MKEERTGKTTGYTAKMPEACERAWNNVREVMRHVSGSAFQAPAGARGGDTK